MDLKISDNSVITNLKIDTSTACGYGHNTIATTPYEAWRSLETNDRFKPCTFTFDSASINQNALARLLGSEEIKEDKMKKNENELKPVYNTEPAAISKDNYAGYSVYGIKVLAANKVVVVTIGDSRTGEVHTYKQICREPDVFDLRYAVALALTKYLQRKPGDRLTTAGLEYVTYCNLTYSYDFNKEVDRALKAYARREREEAMKKAKEEEIKRIKEATDELSDLYVDWDLGCAAIAVHRLYGYEGQQVADFLDEVQKIVKELYDAGCDRDAVWEKVAEETGVAVDRVK